MKLVLLICPYRSFCATLLDYFLQPNVNTSVVFFALLSCVYFFFILPLFYPRILISWSSLSLALPSFFFFFNFALICPV